MFNSRRVFFSPMFDLLHFHSSCSSPLLFPPSISPKHFFGSWPLHHVFLRSVRYTSDICQGYIRHFGVAKQRSFFLSLNLLFAYFPFPFASLIFGFFHQELAFQFSQFFLWWADGGLRVGFGIVFIIIMHIVSFPHGIYLLRSLSFYFFLRLLSLSFFLSFLVYCSFTALMYTD
ncbi:hypothetical protein DFH27DRAFT_390865 [Peziza echinospora]|nr:hypothetical protein DFH27DRAFT_390865 [Peziza echinospora]